MAAKQWKLSELYQYARELLDDPLGDIFADDRLEILVNAAYSEITADAQNSGAMLSIGSEDVTVTAGTREYVLADDTEQVLDVVRADTASTRPRPISIVPYTNRDDRNTGVYFYRKAGTGLIWLGTCDPLPTAMTLRVRSIQMIAYMSNPNDVPFELPAIHRPLIAIRAAVLGKFEENRDPSMLASLYTENLRRFKIWLDHPNVSTAKRVKRL